MKKRKNIPTISWVLGYRYGKNNTGYKLKEKVASAAVFALTFGPLLFIVWCVVGALRDCAGNAFPH